MHIFKKKKPKGYANIRRKSATRHTGNTMNGEKFVRILDAFGVNSAKELKNIDPEELKKFKKALEKGVPYRGTKSCKAK